MSIMSSSLESLFLLTSLSVLLNNIEQIKCCFHGRPDNYSFGFQESRNSKTLAPKWFAGCSSVGLRILVGVIRPSTLEC